MNAQPNSNIQQLTPATCIAAHLDMAFTGRTVCPVCGEVFPTLIQTPTGPQWAFTEMLNSPVKPDVAGSQLAMML